MFKPVLDVLDKVEQNGLSERIDSNPATKKYWLTLGGSIVLLSASMLINAVTIIKRKDIEPATLRTVVMKDGQLDTNNVKQVPITLPAAHSTFKNLTSWLTDAISETYTFGFTNYHEQVSKSEQYFTEDGYRSYLNALQINNTEKEIVTKRIEVATIPLQTPVLINGGIFGDSEFWRFRVPVLVSIQGGKAPIVEQYMVEVLIIRVPSYISYKGIAIAEYNMTKQ
jgi:hypothetical protein